MAEQGSAPALDPKQLAELVASSVRDMQPELLGGLTPQDIGDLAVDMKAIKAGMERAGAQRAGDELADNRKASPSLREYEQVTRVNLDNEPIKGKGLRAGCYVRAMGEAHRTRSSVTEVLNRWGYKKLAEEAEAEQRSLVTGVPSAGGALFAGGFLNELIELQRNQVVTRQIPGIRVINMPNGTMEIKKHTAAATAAYSQEASPIASSQQSFGSITLTGKKLTALTPVSNDLLRVADASADAIVRDDLAQVMALREDLAFLYGSGASGQPRGIRYAVDSAMGVNTGGATAALVRVDLINAMQRMASRNVAFNPGNAAWLMSERSKYRLMGIVNALDLPAFPEVAQGMLMGYKILSTNQIADTFSTDKSEVLFVCGSEVVIGDVRGLELTALDGAAYYNSPTSAVVSGFSNDETAIRAIAVHDIGLRHDNGLSVIQVVAWA